jgi:hypothetical protein
LGFSPESDPEQEKSKNASRVDNIEELNFIE